MICHVYFNMVSYNIKISENTGNLCMLIFILGKYGCKTLSMVFRNPPYFFQYTMSGLLQGFEFICAYIDKLLIIK